MRIVWVGLLSVILFACRKQLPLEAPQAGEKYFPLQVGKYWIYAVEETTYTTAGAQPRRYYLRIRIDTPFTDAYQRRAFYMHWDTTSEFPYAWRYVRTGSAFRDAQTAEWWVDNLRYWMLKFPLAPTVKWDRNAFNAQEPQICRYQTLDTTFLVQNRKYTGIQVLRRNVETFITEKALTYELYAPEVGLVYLYDRYDKWDFLENGTLSRNTDSYFTRWELVESR
ncbi:MAG: hypothetical protein ACUVRD_00520 [Bacteroidia bacterium]